jgi:hypothetical protein
MTLAAVRPEALQIGDPVIIGGERWIVRSIDGPDHNLTFDLYLSNESGDCHKVVQDPIQIINE